MRRVELVARQARMGLVGPAAQAVVVVEVEVVVQNNTSTATRVHTCFRRRVAVEVVVRLETAARAKRVSSRSPTRPPFLPLIQQRAVQHSQLCVHRSILAAER